MKTIKTQILIQAPVDKVWHAFTDFKSYPNWNPFIQEVVCQDLNLGNQLKIKIQPPGRSLQKFSPKIVSYKEGKELSWLGHVLMPGLFDGRHKFFFEPKGKTTVFRQEEDFSGFLVPFMKKVLIDVEHGFNGMNQALKEKVEAQVSQG